MIRHQHRGDTPPQPTRHPCWRMQPNTSSPPSSPLHLSHGASPPSTHRLDRGGGFLAWRGHGAGTPLLGIRRQTSRQHERGLFDFSCGTPTAWVPTGPIPGWAFIVPSCHPRSSVQVQDSTSKEPPGSYALGGEFSHGELDEWMDVQYGGTDLSDSSRKGTPAIPRAGHRHGLVAGHSDGKHDGGGFNLKEGYSTVPVTGKGLRKLQYFKRRTQRPVDDRRMMISDY
jgi:hypothetical protein